MISSTSKVSHRAPRSRLTSSYASPAHVPNADAGNDHFGVLGRFPINTIATAIIWNRSLCGIDRFVELVDSLPRNLAAEVAKKLGVIDRFV